jgi:selenocysteine lyase/cysteine desulfurase
VRIGFLHYNTAEEVDALLEELSRLARAPSRTHRDTAA